MFRRVIYFKLNAIHLICITRMRSRRSSRRICLKRREIVITGDFTI